MNEVYGQMKGIPMGNNCPALVTDFFLFCYDRDFMLNHSRDNQSEIIQAYNCTSRYIDDILNADNPEFHQMVSLIHTNNKLKIFFRSD